MTTNNNIQQDIKNIEEMMLSDRPLLDRAKQIVRRWTIAKVGIKTEENYIFYLKNLIMFCNYLGIPQKDANDIMLNHLKEEILGLDEKHVKEIVEKPSLNFMTYYNKDMKEFGMAQVVFGNYDSDNFNIYNSDREMFLDPDYTVEEMQNMTDEEILMQIHLEVGAIYHKMLVRRSEDIFDTSQALSQATLLGVLT